VPDIITDGRTKVWSVPSISNIAAPTTAELNAGTALETIMTPDGLEGFEPDTADVDNSAMASTFDTKLAGRPGYSGTMLRIKKQSPTADTVYNTMVYGYNTNIVIRRGTASTTAWASSDKVEVYPVQCGEVRNVKPEANTVQRYEIPVKISTQPNLRATVA
jgi:hypothetical protein